MKKITIVGGAGTIGTILTEGLSDKYDIIVLDKMEPKYATKFKKVDATNYEELLGAIPKDSDVLLNLLTIHIDEDLKEVDHFKQMTDIHFSSSFYMLRAAIDLGIPRVVFASSNHTTDYYEQEGRSKLGREITINDYPYSKGLYGVLKLASENIAHIMAHDEANNLSVINLRIGSVPEDEKQALKEKERLHHTLLSREDTVQLFDLALQSTVKYGTYYGVSDNPQKPWSTENAWRELGFVSKVNSEDLLE
ncbi:NAD-dependent epimerase/dehydratase family protein [Bacillus sp. PS06]|uniref:NAD-dependent epimerase/dehydratase family protein n=1 Tax=Bacillus sp. PS06 TaxID=2764176 RepID=UPI00177C5AEB|nr:NAD(P)-dependent oxidoreductase [Bacillus sp. PS06]MBD8069898.1 NAD(P)-dependent oxidoreductase [Bacillus sp. PS06]